MDYLRAASTGTNTATPAFMLPATGTFLIHTMSIFELDKTSKMKVIYTTLVYKVLGTYVTTHRY